MIDHWKRIASFARSGGVDPPEGARERLAEFAALLLERGARLSLVSKGDRAPRPLAEKHFRDAAAGLLFAAPQPGAKVLDFGAGAGVVGITWSILRPDLSVTLLESRHRKTLFMKRAVADLSLSARVVEARGEDLESSDERYDMVVSRGIATDRKTAALFATLLAPGGAALFFKGPESAPEARAILDNEPRLAAEKEETAALTEEKTRVFLLARRR